jgi:hypothetical protein
MGNRERRVPGDVVAKQERSQRRGSVAILKLRGMSDVDVSKTLALEGTHISPKQVARDFARYSAEQDSITRAEVRTLAKEMVNAVVIGHYEAARALPDKNGKKPQGTHRSAELLLKAALVLTKIYGASVTRVEHTGVGGRPINVRDVTKLSDEELDAIIAADADVDSGEPEGPS